MRLDDSHIDEVERDISPPMKFAITIPVVRDTGEPTGCAIYVAASPFTDQMFLLETVRQIAHRLLLTEEL